MERDPRRHFELLSFKAEFGPTEALAALTVAAIIAATAYNLGFFAPIGISDIALLNVQDILIGSSVSAGLIMLAVPYAGIIRSGGMLFGDIFHIINILAIIFIPLITIISFWIEGNSSKYSAIVFLIFGIFAFITIRRISRGETRLEMLLTLLLVFPFFLGLATEKGIISAYTTLDKSIIIYKTGEKVTGLVLRLSSEYAFLYVPPDVKVISMSEIRSISRKVE